MPPPRDGIRLARFASPDSPRPIRLARFASPDSPRPIRLARFASPDDSPRPIRLARFASPDSQTGEASQSSGRGFAVERERLRRRVGEASQSSGRGFTIEWERLHNRAGEASSSSGKAKSSIYIPALAGEAPLYERSSFRVNTVGKPYRMMIWFDSIICMASLVMKYTS